MNINVSNDYIGKNILAKDLIEITKSFLERNTNISLNELYSYIKEDINKSNLEKDKKEIINNDLFMYKLIRHFEIGEIEYTNEELSLLKSAFLIEKDSSLSKDFKEELMSIHVTEKGKSLYSYEQIRRYIEKKLKA